MKVAFVGNIHTECGIATYNESLFCALKKNCDVKFFAEKNGRQSNEIVYCWDRNEFPKYELIDAVDAYKPDVVLFSHEYGIFPKAYFFSSLVSYFKLKGYKVVTIFHSVYEMHKDKLTTESICKNIVVHTREAKDALIRKGLSVNDIHVMHHGCPLPSGEILPKLWNHLGNETVILQAGFLFQYKNHSLMLDVVDQLRNKYKNVLYIIAASENPKTQQEHDQVYASLIEKIKKLQLEHHVVIDRGFLSTEVLMSYIRTCSVCVLPYQPGEHFDVFAASGMARVILQTSTPLITSKANLFHGLDNVVLKASSLDEWAEAISFIFDKKIDLKQTCEARKAFLQNNSWDLASEKLVKIFNSAK